MELTPRILEGAAMCVPVDFKIQHSSDGLSWTDITGQSYINYQCEDTLVQLFRFESIVSARLIRLLITKLGADLFGNFSCQIAEIEISHDTVSVGFESSSLEQVRITAKLSQSFQSFNYIIVFQSNVNK